MSECGAQALGYWLFEEIRRRLNFIFGRSIKRHWEIQQIPITFGDLRKKILAKSF